MSIGRRDLYVKRPKMRQRSASSAENVEGKQLDLHFIWQWIPACWIRTATEKSTASKQSKTSKRQTGNLRSLIYNLVTFIAFDF